MPRRLSEYVMHASVSFSMPLGQNLLVVPREYDGMEKKVETIVAFLLGNTGATIGLHASVPD